MLQSIGDALRQSWANILEATAVFIPRLLAMLIIVLAGWIVGVLVAWLARHLARLLRLHALAERVGAADLLKRAELPDAERAIGSLLFWLVFVSFLLAGLGALGVQGMETLFTDFVRFVPRLVLAIVVLVVGMLVANFAWRATLLASVNANLPSARLLSGTVRVLISLLAAAMALDELGVARNVVLTAFAIAFGALMLGIAIALGIGGGGVARRILERQFPEPGEKPKEDGFSHL